MSPSLFVLGFMASIACLIRPEGRTEELSVLACVLACFAAVLSEAGSAEAGSAVKSRRDELLQLFAVLVFLARLAAFIRRIF